MATRTPAQRTPGGREMETRGKKAAGPGCGASSVSAKPGPFLRARPGRKQRQHKPGSHRHKPASHGGASLNDIGRPNSCAVRTPLDALQDEGAAARRCEFVGKSPHALALLECAEFGAEPAHMTESSRSREVLLTRISPDGRGRSAPIRMRGARPAAWSSPAMTRATSSDSMDVDLQVVANFLR